MIRSHGDDRGVTLIELLIVVGLLGVIMVALAATFSVIVRTFPSTEARIEDARTTVGLVTYLPTDVSSTQPGGIDRPADAALALSQTTGCAGDTPADSYSLVRLEWNETAATATTFQVNYRLTKHDGLWRVVRYACVNGGAPRTINMTGVLPVVPTGWEPGDPPASLTLVGSRGVEIEITTLSGAVMSLKARSNNPGAALSPPTVLPFPSDTLPPNDPPMVIPVDPTIVPDDPATIALDVTDPDVGDGLVVTVTDTPPGWVASVLRQTITVTPPLGAGLGASGTFGYTVTDSQGAVTGASMTVTLAATTNTSPTAGDMSETVIAGTPLLVNVPVHDIDGDPLTLTIGPAPSAGVTASIDPDTRIMTVLSDDSDATSASFGYTVSDGRGGTDSGSVAITVERCAVSSFDPSATSVPLRSGTDQLANDVAYTVDATGPCNDLVLVFDHDGDVATPPDIASFAGRDSVTIKGASGLSNWSTGAHEISLRNGITGPNLRTVSLATT